MSDDGFIELSRPPKRNHGAPVHFATTAHGKGKASFVLSREIVEKAACERFSVAFNPVLFQFRLRPDPAGLFPTGRAGAHFEKSGRRFLRVPLPSELVHQQDAREPAPHEWRGSDLYVTIPPVFRKRAGSAITSEIGKPAGPALVMATKDMIARAAAAVPAPVFGKARQRVA